MPVLFAIIANTLSIIGGNPLNAAADVSTDAHTKGKHDIASATLRLGRLNTIGWAGTEMALAFALAIVVSVWLGHVIVVVGVTLSIALCLLYNLEPVRLKRRGFANPITIGLTLGVLPSLVAYSAVQPDIPRAMWPIFIGISILIMGRALWWTLPDQLGDGATGIMTPAVRYGTFRVIIIACAVTAVGLGLLGWGLWWRYGPAWALIGMGTSGAFLLNKLILLYRMPNHTLPDSTQMRRRHLVTVTIADALLVALPLGVQEG